MVLDGTFWLKICVVWATLVFVGGVCFLLVFDVCA